ncbi:MAG: DUF4956 domain-containing protein [Oscillospiraceae bacterium]|nr:DUF4956 domain-containing protein [Oscillospiraceae bacterium]
MFEFGSGSIMADGVTLEALLFSTVTSLLFGFVVALLYMFRNKHSKTLAMTLVVLPAMVQIIIMLVNRNIGAGIAVAGAFSLIRFRSVPGNARDISCLFFAMALGFISGMGYLLYGLVFCVLLGSVFFALTYTQFGQEETQTRILRITIPEDLDYDSLFDDIFAKYTQGAELEKVRTSNMGSLYELTYSITMREAVISKAFMDELRCRNGNLKILFSRGQSEKDEL